MDQRELVDRAGRGDHDAFAQLAGASIAQLEAVARLILRDRELARDAVQEALIRAWRDLPGLRDPDRFDAWLHRLLVNASIDEARRRRRRVIEVDLASIEIPVTDAVLGSLADRDRLDRALAGLAPEHRALVVLHYYLCVPLPEAAASLGISLGAAKSRLNRSVVSLRRSIVREPLELGDPAAGGPS